MFRYLKLSAPILFFALLLSSSGCLPVYTPEDDNFSCYNQEYDSDEDIPKIFVYADHAEKVLSQNALRNKRCTLKNSQLKIILYNYSGYLCKVTIGRKNGKTSYFGDIYNMTYRVLVSDSLNGNSDEFDICISLANGKSFSEKWHMRAEKEIAPPHI
ncbi:hypothetical protein IJT93_11330 [bacterium]|nr:hypothetical protein [bacterium]